ncbi:MAG: FRG domain-containing protein [Phycisphaerales bacterium]
MDGMVNRQVLTSWEQFKHEAERIISEKKSIKKIGELPVDHALFRGQSDSTWPLQPTLDRLRKKMGVSDYCEGVIPLIEKSVATCTGRRWDLSTRVHLGEFDLPAYEFMACLRHNGFPSPLLDWTKSPYIAGYFAFGDVYLSSKQREYVSIFVCVRHFWSGDEPHIRSLGPNIATHRNHYLQQSEYTICIGEEKEGDTKYFANHEDVEDDDGDILIKYDIPVSEQEKVLSELDSMNITAYSLFGSETSLMDTLAIRELVLEM